MQFRTELSVTRSPQYIDRSSRLLLLGSCFSDEVGQRLAMDGFRVTVNPLGPVYNPVTLGEIVERALHKDIFKETDLVAGPRGMHCLTFASRYSGPDPCEVIEAVNRDFSKIIDALSENPVVILTLGTSYVFTHHGSGRIVGNCHKFHPAEFSRRRLSVEEITDSLFHAAALLRQQGCRVIFTVSPIRHLADGFHGNTLSKASLHLAVDSIKCAEYFPAYEAVIDDLRDYRFYAEDMKHPSQVAVDYIYDLFSKTYFSNETMALARDARADFKKKNHRQILS